MVGVTSTRSSVLVRFTFLDLKSSPRMGTSAIPGNFAELHGGALVQQTGNAKGLSILAVRFRFLHAASEWPAW